MPGTLVSSILAPSLRSHILRDHSLRSLFDSLDGRELTERREFSLDVGRLCKQLLQRPCFGRESSGNGWCALDRRMRSAPVVPAEVQRQHGLMVLPFLRVASRQSCHTTVVCADAQITAFHDARADPRRIRVPTNRYLLNSHNFWRRVPSPLGLVRDLEVLGQLCESNRLTERGRDCCKVRTISVS